MPPLPRGCPPPSRASAPGSRRRRRRRRAHLAQLRKKKGEKMKTGHSCSSDPAVLGQAGGGRASQRSGRRRPASRSRPGLKSRGGGYSGKEARGPRAAGRASLRCPGLKSREPAAGERVDAAAGAAAAAATAASPSSHDPTVCPRDRASGSRISLRPLPAARQASREAGPPARPPSLAHSRLPLPSSPGPGAPTPPTPMDMLNRGSRIRCSAAAAAG